MVPGMAEEIRNQRVPVLFTKAELERLDDWMFTHRVRGRGEAIRQLMELGFQASERGTKPAGQKKRSE
jgi:hypothetical protein